MIIRIKCSNLKINEIVHLSSEFIVIVLYSIYVLLHALTSTQLSKINALNTCQTLFNYIAIVGLVTSFCLMHKISIKNVLFSIAASCLLVLIVFHANSATESTLLILFILSGMHLKSERIFYCYFFIIAVAVLLTLFLCFAGILPDVVAYDFLTDRKRHYLGFNYTSYLSNYFFHILLVYFYLFKKITIRSTVVILMINFCVMRLTDTRAVYYLVILLVVLAWMEKKLNWIFQSRIAHLSFVLVMPVLATSMIYLAYNYTAASAVYSKLDAMLSTRLQMGHKAITDYGFPLFGTHIVWSVGQYGVDRTTAYFYVDSSYLNGVYTYGLALVVAVIVGFSVMNHSFWKRRQYLNCLILTMLAAHGFTDPQLMILLYNPFLLLIGSTFCKRIHLFDENFQWVQLQQAKNSNNHLKRTWYI